jgi:hypothetical protein
MRLTDDKITHLSHVVFKELVDRDIIQVKEEEGKIRREIRRVITMELKIGENIDEAVRRKLQSYSRKIIEGSPEWEVLYKKFYQEEEIRRGRSS